MATSYEDKIKQQGEAFLEPGERVLAAFICQPRGTTTAKAGGLGPGAFGGRKVKQANQAGQASGLQLASPMALAVTESRLVVFGVSQPIAMGKGGDVKDLVSAVPLTDVDSIEVKRLLVGKVVHLSVGGVAMKLEAGAGADAKGLVAAFERVTTPA
jgi:hypothetical protein